MGVTGDYATAERMGLQVPTAFAAGSSIAPSDIFHDTSGPGELSGNAFGGSPAWEFPDDGTAFAYLGFQFFLAGEPHYGYVYLTTTAPPPSSRVYGLALKDWAYESDPNTPILAGATSSVPEPASAALIAGGAAALALFRKRKKILENAA